MLRTQYQEYIHDQLLELTRTHPELKDSQRAAYMLGFLESQLADAMYNDSHVAQRFKQHVNQMGLTSPVR